MLTDTEVLATFMEPRPANGRGERVDTPESRWWSYDYHVVPKSSGRPGKEFCWQWHPQTITLNEAREIEARLTGEQWAEYRGWFMVQHQMDGHQVPFGTYLLHASAPAKEKALAAVLRPLVAPEETQEKQGRPAMNRNAGTSSRGASRNVSSPPSTLTLSSTFLCPRGRHTRYRAALSVDGPPTRFERSSTLTNDELLILAHPIACGASAMNAGQLKDAIAEYGRVVQERTVAKCAEAATDFHMQWDRLWDSRTPPQPAPLSADERAETLRILEPFARFNAALPKREHERDRDEFYRVNDVRLMYRDLNALASLYQRLGEAGEPMDRGDA